MKRIIHNGLYDDYAPEIREALNEKKRILIKAPTGTGKTYLMKRLAIEYNAVILVPTLDMLALYASNEIATVTSDSLSMYNPMQPCVMVWDAAVKMEGVDKSHLLQRVWFIDEVHALFDDRRYRTSAVETMLYAKKVERLFCATATPSGEVEELGLHLMEYSVDRNAISTSITTTAKPEAYINALIKNARNQARKCVVLTDQYAASLWAHQYYGENNRDIQLLHSRERGTAEYEQTLHGQGDRGKFNKGTTLCTRVVEMGLNFMNAESMLVVVHLNLGEHTANRIIQFVGRLRKCQHIQLVAVVDTRYKDKGIEQRTRDNYILNEITSESVAMRNEAKARIKGYDDDLSADKIIALAHIENYTRKHSTVEAIRRDLENEGYFSIVQVVAVPDDKLRKNEECTKSEEEFREMLLDEDWENAKLDANQQRWLGELRKMNALGFNLKEFILGGFTTCKRIDNIINDAYTIIRVGEFKGRENDFNAEFDYELLNKIDPSVSNSTYKEMQGIFSRCKKYFELLTSTATVEDYYNACIDGKARATAKAKAARKDNGKKAGTSNKQRIGIRNKFNGKICWFNSKGEAMEWLGCSKMTFSTFVSRGGTKLNKTYEVVKEEGNGVSLGMF